MSPEATNYLNQALSYIQQNSIKKEQVDWETVRDEAFSLAQHAQTPGDTYPAIRLILKRLGDQHSNFLTPEEATLFFDGSLKEPGLLAVHPEGVVAYIFPGSAAEQAGVQVGDTIETINRQPPTSFGVKSFREALQAATVNLTLRQAGSEAILSVTLHAAVYDLNIQPYGKYLEHGIGYLSLPGFVGDDTRRQEYVILVQQIIRDVDQRDICGWVVDLRLNRGGALAPNLAGIGPILGEGECVWLVYPEKKLAYVYRDGQAFREQQEPTQVDEPYHLKQPVPPVAVLTSHITTSSGEFVTLAFQGRPRTRRFGEPTFGVPTGNGIEEFSDGAVLLLTEAFAADRTGRTYNGPIPPDQFVKIDWTLLGTEHDPVLRAACNWLLQQEECLQP